MPKLYRIAFLAVGLWQLGVLDVRADLLVSDNGASQVLRYDETSGAFLGTVVSPGSGGLIHAIGLRMHPDGTLLVTSQHSSAILRYDVYTGAYLGVFASNAATPGAKLGQPADLFFGPDGNLYVANFFAPPELGYSPIGRFTPGGAALGGFISGAPGIFSSAASGIFGPDGLLYVGAFNGNSAAINRIFRYYGPSGGPQGQSPGSYKDTFVVGDSTNQVAGPSGMLFDAAGNLYVANLYSHYITKFGITNGAITSVTPFTTDSLYEEIGEHSFPSSMKIMADGSMLVAETGGKGVYRFNIGADSQQDFGYNYGKFTGAVDANSTPLDIPGNMLVVPGRNQWGTVGDGTWSAGGSWATGSAPDGNTATALLWNQVPGTTVNLQDSTYTVKQLRFLNTTAPYTVSSNPTGKLILDSNYGNALLQFDAGNSQNHAVSANLRYQVNTDAVLVDRTLSLSGQQDWFGKTLTVKSGTLKFDNASATNIASGSALIVNNGAAVELAGTKSGTSGTTAADGYVNVTNNGALLVSGTNQAIGALDGAGSLTVGKDSLGIFTNAQLSASRVIQTAAAGLTINGDATHEAAKVTIRTSAAGSLPVRIEAAGSNTASRISTLVIDSDPLVSPPGIPYSSAQRAYHGTLDLTNNDLVIDNNANSATLLASVVDMIRAGQNGTKSLTWTGKGITSSYASNSANPFFGATGLGMIKNDMDPSTDTIESPRYSSFGGITGLTGKAILIKYTYYGDLNLDGQVTALDFAQLDAGYTGKMVSDLGEPSWFYGDINFDGRVDSFDFALMEAGYSAYRSSNIGNMQPLPEPSTVSLAAFGLVTLLATTCYRARKMARMRSRLCL